MASNVNALNSVPLMGAFQYNPYANDYFDDLDMNFNQYPMGTGGSIFDGYNLGGGIAPMAPVGGVASGNKSYFDNMKDYQKFYVDYNVDQQTMQRNADLRINASMEAIQGSAAVLQDKIKQNEQDQIEEAMQAYFNSVGAAYGGGSDKEVKARALTLYQNMTGKSLIQDLRDNGHSSFTQGLLQSLTFSTTYRTSAEDNISKITGQPVGTAEKTSHNAGRLVGAAGVGVAVGSAAKWLSKGKGKVGVIAGLAAAGISAALSFITGKASS